MKIVLSDTIKFWLGRLVGNDKKNAIVAYLENDLKAAVDALFAIPAAAAKGNAALVKAQVGIFMAHLPTSVEDAIVSWVKEKYGITLPVGDAVASSTAK